MRTGRCGIGIPAFIAAVLVALAAHGQDLSLIMVLADYAIPQDGVLAGEVIMTNTAKHALFAGSPLNEFRGDLSYELDPPHQAVVTYDLAGLRALSNAGRGTLHLAPGGSIKHPVLLVRSRSAFVFHDRGIYRIRAKYVTGAATPESSRIIYSPWAEIAVLRAGAGHDQYAAALGGEPLLYAFCGVQPAMGLVQHLAEFKSYAREAAKIAIFRLAENDKEQRKRATALAREYGIGVAMWDCLNAYAECPRARDMFATCMPPWNVYDFLGANNVWSLR